MALTKVSGHIIDQPFDVGIITATNFRSGVATVGTMHVTGNLQVDGTTTTLDTVVTEVDRLEVSANSTVAAGIITQTGSGDGLLVLGGNVGIGTNNPRYSLEVYDSNLLVSGSSAGNLILEDRGVADSSRPFTVLNNDGGYFNINRSNRNASGTTTSSALALRIDPNGKVRIGSSGGDVSVLNVHAETDGNLHVRPIADVTGTTPGGSGVVFDVLNDASNTVKDIAFRGATTIFRNASTETLRITSGGNVSIQNDSGKFTAGAGDDLQIYHDGSFSTIKNTASGITNAGY